MINHYYAVIMAGGGGTRLWPLSRQARPKQMVSLFDERTLFQTSVERIRDIFPVENIYVVTVEEQARELQAQSPYIPEGNFILEPTPRGTASVVGLAAITLQKRDPQAIMAILTSDHYIGNEGNFRETLQTACSVAQDGYLVTLGITPTFPATGYGYIQRGQFIKKYDHADVYKVIRFTEKPDEKQVKAMLDGGDHTWNSGMFVWKTEQILNEFKRQMPELYRTLKQISLAWDTPDWKETVDNVWPHLKQETIDYGIMEGAQNIAVIPAANLQWSDVGSWDSLFEVLPTDKDGNIVMGGAHVGLDTTDSLIYLSQERRLIVTIGVSGLILVDTGDVLMVCSKDQAQKVRQVVNYLRKTNQHYV
jgi:mannose-1-phosphate guanylyltransferase